MNRNILFDHSFGMHSSFWEVVNYPPEGYQFQLPNSLWDRFFDKFIARNHYITGNLALAKLVNKLVPPRLIKALLDTLFKKDPKNQPLDLVFSMDHPVMSEIPWVIFITWPTALLGINVDHLNTYKRTIENQLASDGCKGIITWSELSKNAILERFDGRSFEHKLEVVPLAMHKQTFTKVFNDDVLKIFFLGSANTPQNRLSGLLGDRWAFEFDTKGGRELLHAFRILNERYPNLELVMRTGVPGDLLEEFGRYPNIKFINRLVPRAVLEEEFRTADMFVYPTHMLTPWTAFLEAMSYELPIITTDLYTNPEFVQHGITGLLVKPSQTVPYYWKGLKLPMGTPLHHQYLQAVKTPDPAMVDDLVEKVSMLVENTDQRRQMGRQARWEIEEGKHSIRQRNKTFKSLFDHAVS